MTRLRSITAVPAALGIALALTVAGCGGGGGSSSGTITVPNSLIEIRVQGVTTPLWQNVAGTPTSPPVCPTGVFLNASLTFTFNGAVDQGSLPGAGSLAQGPINITTTNAQTTSVAQGSFTVVDDPTLPAGNNRRVLFTPVLPSSAANPCESGFTAGASAPAIAAGATFTVFVPKSGNSPQTVTIAGQGLSNEAVTCFRTCPCPQPAPATQCTSVSTDITPGPPFVLATTPATADVPSTSIDPCSIANNQVVMTLSEPLSPANITTQNVKVINTLSGLQVPGTVTFTQGGTGGVPATQSRIVYTASAPLLGSTLYEITFTNLVKDFGGNALVTNVANPTLRLRFQTNPVTFVPGTPFLESFNSPVNLGTTTGAISWSSSGSVNATYPLEFVGTGAAGAFAPATTPTSLDTLATLGIFNFTSVTINPGITVRVKGDYLCHWRVLGAVAINGTVNLSAGANTLATAPFEEQGAMAGQFNEGGTTSPNTVRAGRGNAGAGDGGRGSPGAGVRSAAGEGGFGARVSGTSNPGPVGANTFFGGGAGGDSGFFPPQVAGELGGLGGAGGSAGTAGGAGSPRLTTPAYPNCTVNATATQVIAQGTGIPPVFVQPISQQSGGSGGGGGGDHLDDALAAPGADDQGGGGGGGGGSLRISCVGNYTQGASGIITANGTVGGAGSTNAGSGGSGSGGQVWIQAFSSITLATTSVVSIDGPLRLATTGCAAGAGGDGGEGLCQFEAGVGTPSTTFVKTPGAPYITAPFPFSSGVTGTVTSTFFDTTYGAPDFTGAVESKTQGNAAGAVLVIAYEGAPESTSTPGTPDVTLIKSLQAGSPITAATLDALDGYRFIRFKVTITYPAPPATPANAILPSVEDITISYNIAPTCP